MALRPRTLFLDSRQIHDWDSFHDAFARLFGFPSSYGRTMEDWLMCLSQLDNASSEMTMFHLSHDEIATIYILDTGGLAKRCPTQLQTLEDYLGRLNEEAICRRGTPLIGFVYR